MKRTAWERLSDFFSNRTTVADPWSQLDTHDASHEPADHELSDDLYDEAYWREQHINDLAAAAGDSGANADLAAAYLSNYDGYEEAQADWAAARQIRDTLPAAVLDKVNDWETYKNRPATQHEIHWLEHRASEEAAEQAGHASGTTDEDGTEL